MSDFDPIQNLHTQLRRQISDWDADGLFKVTRPGHDVVAPLVARLRRGEILTLAECADVCRYMAWDVESFYDAVRVESGDYHQLIQLNGGVYFNLRAPDWDS